MDGYGCITVVHYAKIDWNVSSCIDKLRYLKVEFYIKVVVYRYVFCSWLKLYIYIYIIVKK